MKVLCVSDAFWPDHTDGITKSLLLEVEGLVDLGHQVSVVSRRLQASHPRFEARNGYEVYRYLGPSRNSILYRLYPLFSLVVLPRLVLQLYHRLDFDVVFTNDPFQVGGLRRILSESPYVYNYHASVASEIRLDATRGKYSFFRPLVNVITPWVATIEDQALTHASRIVVDSQFMGHDLCRQYEGIDHTELKLIPLPIDTVRFSPAKDRATTRQSLKLPINRPILLTVRRLVARMGIENLITAMKMVKQEFPGVLLLIGGAGYLKDHFLEMIHELDLEHNINMIGFIPEELLPAYYQAADLFVLPTLSYEGFGLITVEALACGTPVIATPVGATPEVLGPLGSEFFFENSTPEAIASGIGRWLVRGVNDEVRQQCRAYCADHFNKERICRQLESVLAESATINA
jgi:glycosyltransferase involved in cell wall biosynthesis